MIRRLDTAIATAAVLGEKVPEYPFAVLGGEARAVQRDPELGGDRARILEVLRGGAVAFVVLFPVAHEESLHLPARLLEEQGCHCGIDSAGEADDDSRTGTGPWGQGRHGQILTKLQTSARGSDALAERCAVRGALPCGQGRQTVTAATAVALCRSRAATVSSA